ncbi:MAG TPA: hypothetical protein PLS00_13520, partial [Niabella sp.]|nr:hypothetical protein [Niabella sp.]
MLFFLPGFLWSQDATTIQKIREEGLNNTQVMDIAFQLTEVSGPRVTGSPGLKRASDYAVNQLKQWGLTDVV